MLYFNHVSLSQISMVGRWLKPIFSSVRDLLYYSDVNLFHRGMAAKVAWIKQIIYSMSKVSIFLAPRHSTMGTSADISNNFMNTINLLTTV